MQPSPSHLRTRPISARHLRVFEAVARHLNFSAAADEIALTQSTLSRQVQALEEEVGTKLFLRHSRSVELTSAGTQLLMAVSPWIPRIDNAVRQIRQGVGRRVVSIAAQGSLTWLIHKLDDFQRRNPDCDVRIETPSNAIDVASIGIDVALIYGPVHNMPPTAVRLFGDCLTPVVSPRLLKDGSTLKAPSDLAKKLTLIESADAYPIFTEWRTWRRWFDAHGVQMLQPQWLYLDRTSQIVQAALAGQGVALAPIPLVEHALATGDLIEPLPKLRIGSPFGCWLITSPRSARRPEVESFCEWLVKKSEITRGMMGEAQDPVRSTK